MAIGSLFYDIGLDFPAQPTYATSMVLIYRYDLSIDISMIYLMDIVAFPHELTFAKAIEDAGGPVYKGKRGGPVAREHDLKHLRFLATTEDMSFTDRHQLADDPRRQRSSHSCALPGSSTRKSGRKP
jgi:hypothetical protein